MRTMERVDVSRVGEEIHVNVSARSFLHSQVRSMVGSLAPIGRGHKSEGEITRQLAAQDRRECGPLAPPQGLYFVRVDYPEG
jgi:tRNA pseudouridine38-40 synthase